MPRPLFRQFREGIARAETGVRSLPAPFELIYVPTRLMVPGDATATASHVRAFETLLRRGIVNELVAATMFVYVALAPTGC